MSLLGSVFGDAKDGPDKSSRDSTARASEAAQYTFQQTSPILQKLSQRYGNFLNNGLDVTTTPQYAALRDATDQQYGQARNNILSTIQPGGSLTNALSGLERNRASSMVQGVGNLTDQELARAFAFGTGQSPVALGGLNAVANTAAYSSAAQSAQQGAANRQLGSAIGNYLSRSNNNTGGKGSSTEAAGNGFTAGAGY